METQGHARARRIHSNSQYAALAISALVCVLSACGGGSNKNPVPTISSLSPDHANAGGSNFTLTVNGSNFISSSVVNWNDAARPTNFVNSGQLTASIGQSDIAAVGMAQVSVFNPAPQGGTSGHLTFSISGAGPSITLLSPASIAAGGPAFTLSVSGANFNANTVVRWNGQDRTSQFVNPGAVTVQIPASDIAAAGIVKVTTFNPGAGGGESAVFNFPVFLSLSTADLIYDAINQNKWIYASVPANAGTGTANSITAIDPVAGKVLQTPSPVTVPTPSDPGRLALSDDGQFLYFGLNLAPSVRRLNLSSGTPELDPLSISLGGDPSLRAETLLVLQASAGNSIAVARRLPGTPRNAGVAIYDAGIGMRPTTTQAGSSPNVLQLCTAPSVLFGLNVGDGPPEVFGFYLMTVDASGITVTATAVDLSGNDISLGVAPGSVERVFSTSGQVLSVADQTIAHTFPAGITGPVKADTAAGRVFYLVQNPAPSTTTWTVHAFSVETYAPNGTFDIPGVNGNPSSFIRWGTNGLAFRTDSNQVFLITSSLVAGP